LDGSKLAERALGPAVTLATALGASLHLVRVISTPVSISEDLYANDYGMLEDACGAYLDEVRQGLEFKGELVTAARMGSPASRLADYAAAHEIDLVVMTSHGRGGLARSLLGSVAGRMVGEPTPVWLVRSQPQR
jgi:nucleotide-binding universal stress UspA family protein